MPSSRSIVQLPKFLSVAVGLLLVIAANPAKAFETVIIDPGHGGMDAGAYWYGIKEKDLTLDLGLMVEELLKERGIKVVLTRRTDTPVTLDERAKIANKHTDAIFVSLHFNAVVSKEISGIETYYLSDEGRKLASMVQTELTRRINTKNRGVKKNSLKVLRLTKCTAILIEGGFLSNRWENQRCSAKWYRQILAEEIVEGIMRYR